MAHDALRTLLPYTGWSDGRLSSVTFTGSADPVLPTPFRIGAAGAATLAATGLAAAELWELKTGRRQNVAVDVRQATASLRGGRYMKLGDDRSRDEDALKGVPAEFTPEEIARWSMITETPHGRLQHLKPVVQMSETPPYWARPSVPLGYHHPVWPARDA